MGTEAQNQDPVAEVTAAAVEEGTAAQASAVARQAGAAQVVAKPTIEPEVEAETPVAAEATAEEGSRGILSTAKRAFEVTFESRKRTLDRPARKPDAGDGDDAQQDQR